MALVERGGLHCAAPDWKEFSKMLIIFNHQPIIEMHPVSWRGPLELQVSMVSLPLYVGGSGGSSPGPFQPFKFFPPPHPATSSETLLCQSPVSKLHSLPPHWVVSSAHKPAQTTCPERATHLGF